MKSLIEHLRFSGNIYRALALRLLLAMFLFSLCRVGFYLYNTSFFPGMTLGTFARLALAGLQFDLVSVLYFNMIFIVLMIIPFDFRFRYSYQETLKYLFFVFNGLALAINVSDFIYYKFTLRRTTADVFEQFENEQNLTGLAFQFVIDYWYAVLFWLGLIILMVKLYNTVEVWGPQTRNKVTYYLTGFLLVPFIAGLVTIGIRGGIRHSTRPITLSNAGQYVDDPKYISIVLNTPFALIRTYGKTKIQKAKYYDADELEKIYSPIHTPHDSIGFKKQNVVVIILESFSKEFFKTFHADKEGGQYPGYTPFLDSLLTHSLTYEYSFANGRKSIDGLPSVISSIPSLGVPYFLSPYSGDRINSLPSLLKPRGYHTSFFHGAPNGSMGFQAFMNMAGVDEYYGMTEYNNDEDFDGMWGIWDEKFFQFYADKLNTFQEPFMSSIFSVSSHHPFVIPDEFKEKFKGGPLPIHKCVQYTDYGLRRFFVKASKMPWYENTLFVITADHTSSEIQFDEHRTSWGFYSIPIIFFKPDHSLRGREQEIFQQIDIMPTVLGYLHFDKPYVGFGRDDFREGDEPVAFNYKDNAYQLFYRDYLLIYDGTRVLGLYDFKKDKMIEHNLIGQLPEVEEGMKTKIKAIIQQYNNRLIEDRLTVSEPTTTGIQ